jgi:glutamate/tyrosine decarboxylase-like PLP-dependent enzyme
VEGAGGRHRTGRLGTIDAHKWFFVPFGAGMLFCRHRDVVGETFRVRADYMPKPQDDT